MRCDCCGEDFEELVDVEFKKGNLPAIVCESCSDDEDLFKSKFVEYKGK